MHISQKSRTPALLEARREAVYIAGPTGGLRVLPSPPHPPHPDEMRGTSIHASIQEGGEETKQ